MKHLLSIIFILFHISLFAQSTIDIDGEDCGIHGTARYNSREYISNEYKNRSDYPKRSDFDTTVTLAALARSKDQDQFSQDKSAIVTGYVYNVKMGGVESCNCKTKDPQYRDTHIELTVNDNRTGPEYRVIAEVTPRFRAMMEKKGIDWSTEGLRKAIKGQWVEIRGWIFFDPEHVEESFANDPKDVVPGKNWRASCWEIHPITYIKIGGSGILPKQITSEDVPGNRDTGTPTTFFFFWVVLAAIALILLWLIVRRRR